MVSTRFFVVLSAIALALASPFSKRDAITVENDINNNIAPATTKLANDVNGFPASGLVGALGIHTDATNLVGIVNNATTDANAVTSVTEAQGQAILGDIEKIEPTILSTLTAIVTKKADFQALPIGGVPALVLSDLKSLNTSVIAFANALIAKAPTDLKPNATVIENAVASAFATAIAAYS